MMNEERKSTEVSSTQGAQLPVEKHDTANEVETEEHWQTEGHIHRHPLIDFCHDYAEHDICDDYDYDYLIHDHVDDL